MGEQPRINGIGGWVRAEEVLTGCDQQAGRRERPAGRPGERRASSAALLGERRRAHTGEGKLALGSGSSSAGAVEAGDE